MYDLKAIRLKRCKHDIASRLLIREEIIEIERILFNGVNKVNSLVLVFGNEQDTNYRSKSETGILN